MVKKLTLVILCAASVFMLLPLWMVISGSFMGTGELEKTIGPVLNGAEGMAVWPAIPKYPTLRPYVELLLDSPSFFVMFWNSCRQVFPIMAGQLVIAAPAAWAFSRYDFPLKKLLFSIYIILMIMPFQVTMVSNYLILDRMKLMNTDFAIILPAVFAALPVFIMEKFFAGIPESLIEAAELDGAGEITIFLKIGIPIGAPGIISAMILSFLENWNAIEQPLTFLSDPHKWPLSLYLPNIATEKAGVSLAASVIMLLPALLIFVFGQEYLEQGIQASGIKE